ncbi:MAG: SPFH domain-containing protein [Bifidobacteriaceae bacterium]|jgi:membrane protease subunit (stomatin/prohibitin family)|nr:SPFH domain-containing protein [Bifidobacteriaceae bacterium]
MGLIKAAVSAIGGNLADQWLDAIQPASMGPRTLAVRGEPLHTGRRTSNRRGTPGYISHGSRIVVPVSTAMILTDGGAVGSFTAEPGYYTVDAASAPSIFSGDLGASVRDAWTRFTFGGSPPVRQVALFVNLREMRDVKFGTSAPVTYFDSFYQAELSLRAHGVYSFQVTDPLLFFKNVCPPDSTRVDVEDIEGQLLAEFCSALQSAISRLSMEGYRISHMPAAAEELNRHMDDALDTKWRHLRGIEILSTAIASISYTEESQRLVAMRSQGAMMAAPGVGNAFAQSAVAEGLRAAGSNPSGAMGAFAGMAMGAGAAGSALFTAGSPPAPPSADGVLPRQPATSPHGGGTPPAPGPLPVAAQGGAGAPGEDGDQNQPVAQDRPTSPTRVGRRFCPGCGAPLPPDARFCPGCGEAQA